MARGPALGAEASPVDRRSSPPAHVRPARSLKDRSASDHRARVARRASLCLAALVTAATGFDYVWLGPAPVWLLVMVLGGVAIVLTPREFGAFHLVGNRLALRVILPWVGLLFAMAVSDLWNDCLSSSFVSVIAYSLVGLAALLVAATWSSLTDWKRVTLTLALVAGAQGVIAVAQYLGAAWAWRLPETILTFTARGEQIGLVGAIEQFDIVGRVRGTSIYVHKFAAFQGILVAFVLTVVLGSTRRMNLGRNVYVLMWTSLLLGILGALLTFSRSSFLGILLALGMVSVQMRGRARRNLRILLALGVVLVVGLMLLDVGGSKQAMRLFEYSGSDSNNQYRYNVWALGLSEFARSPIVGVGSGVDTSSVGIAIHSVAIRMLASYGMLGFLCYALGALGVIATLRTGARSRNATAQLVALGGLSAFLVALVDASTHTSGLFFSDVAQPVLVGIFLGQVVRPWPEAAENA